MNIEDWEKIELIDCGVSVVEDKKFRITNKKLFLTYSGKFDKRELFEWFITNIGELKWFKISHETYKELDANGNLDFHTHFLLEFTNKPDIKNVRHMDYKNSHPHIKRVCSNPHFANAVRYLDKEDEQPYTNIKMKDLDSPNEIRNEVFEKVQKHDKWKNVINDPSIREEVYKKMTYWKEVWEARTPPKIPAKLKYQELMPYQKKIYNHLKQDPIQRQIIWCWSDKPNQGKSELKNFINSKLNTLDLKVEGKSQCFYSDLANRYDDEEVLFFDLPWGQSKTLHKRLQRSFEEEQYQYSNTLLNVLETLSNKGSQLSSGKYRGRKCIINSHILVFSNCPPTYIEKMLPERLYVVEAKLEILKK